MSRVPVAVLLSCLALLLLLSASSSPLPPPLQSTKLRKDVAVSPSDAPDSFAIRIRPNSLLSAPRLLGSFSVVLGASALSLSAHERENDEARLISSMKSDAVRIEPDALQQLIAKGWWKAATEAILRAHREGTDVDTAVRSAVTEVRRNADELLRILDKRHDEIAVVSPALQWAQSPDEVHLNVKFAYRWSSPGALSVEEERIETKGASTFLFSGVGTHSGVKKLFKLELELWGEIDEQQVKWSFASVGKVYIILRKKERALWQSLTRSGAKAGNIAVWWDMREKLQHEVDKFNDEAKVTGENEEGGFGDPDLESAIQDEIRVKKEAETSAKTNGKKKNSGKKEAKSNGSSRSEKQDEAGGGGGEEAVVGAAKEGRGGGGNSSSTASSSSSQEAKDEKKSSSSGGNNNNSGKDEL